MAITISGENNNDRIIATDGVIDSISGFNISGIITASSFTGDLTGDVTGNLTGNVTGNINNTTLLLQTGGTERIRIDSSGRVGLGIDNPGDYFASYNRVVMGRPNDAGSMTIVSAPTYGGYIAFADGTSGNQAYRGLISYYHGQDAMVFGTDGGTERLRIDSTGDVRFAGNNLTNNTNKNVNLTAPSYNTSEEDVNLIQVENESGMNQISFGGGTTGLNAATTLRFLTASAVNTTTGTERLRIDSSGRLLINRINNDAPGGSNSKLQIRDTSYTASISIVRNDPGGGGPYLIFGKSRNATQSDNTLVQNGDILGQISFYGADGNDMNSTGAVILAQVDGTPGSNDMPGRLVFKTTPDGGASSNERLRITAAGKIGIEETSPDTKLHIKNGTLMIHTTTNFYTGSGENGENYPTIFFKGDHSSGNNPAHGKITVRHSGQNTYSGDILLMPQGYYGGSYGYEEVLRVSAHKRVGINDSSPDAVLTIKGDTDATTLPSIRLKDGTDTREVSITNTAGDFLVSTHGTDNTQHGYIKLFESGIFSVATGGTYERFRIDSGGGVRINNTRTTSTKLHVVGGTGSGTAYDVAVFAGGINSTNGSGARIWLTGCENDPTARGTVIEGLMTDNQNAHALIFKTSAAAASPLERLRIASDGRVTTSTTGVISQDFGTTSSTGAYLHFDLGANGANIGYMGAGNQLITGATTADLGIRAGANFVISTGGTTERLRIDSNGRIILGSSSNTAFTTVSYRLFQIGQADGGWINLARTGTPADGNHLGAIQGFARGADGNYNDTVAIDFKADGTPSNTSKPSKIEFFATPSGSTSKELKKTIRASGSQQNYVGTQSFDIYSTGSGEQHSLRLLNSDASAGNEIGIYFGPANNVAGAYISGYAYGDFASTANRDAGLRFGVRQNGTFKEVVRINDGGFFQATNIEGNYETHTFAADLGHQFNSNQRYKTTLWLRNTNTNFENGMLRCAADRGANTAYHFITCTSGDLTDDEYRVRGDGQVYADGSFNSGGADYAEYFEWTDGNSSNEDRIGMTVVLDGNKVKLSTSSDSTDNIIGVVSSNPTVVGDDAWNKWTDKYLKDDFNRYILDSDGHRQLNSSYDDTKTYVSREDRQEWDAIGMVGKLRIVKGQKTGTRWIKMRDISDTVEEWLVR